MSAIIMSIIQSVRKPKTRVLVVDDQASITNLWRVMLEKTGGYIVREENHGLRALDAARDFQPDVMLLDISMPFIDGPEIARLVGRDEELGDTPIIFLSGLVSALEVAAGKRIEGRPCLPKPTCVVALVETIEDTLALAC